MQIHALEQQAYKLVTQLAEQMLGAHRVLACAESCTGGLLAKTCTDLAGSSAWFDRAFITYSNQSKTDMLGVGQELIARHGAVSPEVARQMVKGALRNSQADLAVSITGIAGPGGGTPGKPVGTVCFAFASKSGTVISRQMLFEGDRQCVRYQSVIYALEQLLELRD